MKITLNHTFVDVVGKNAREFFVGMTTDGVVWTNTTLQRYMENVKRLAKQQEEFDEETFIGWGFELLIEAMIKLSPADGRIGITSYRPRNRNDGKDMGVDGIGIGWNGKTATVQCKYRSNPMQTLNSNDDHLSNFVSESVTKFGVTIEKSKNMLVVTTAHGIQFDIREKMFNGQVRCIAFEHLTHPKKGLINGNFGFWLNFFKLLT